MTFHGPPAAAIGNQMPFNPPFPGSFTTSSIRDYAATLPGVYGISNATEWIYIGESDNIQEALLGHLQELSTPLSDKAANWICVRNMRMDKTIGKTGPTHSGI
jgi:hypothetical protein